MSEDKSGGNQGGSQGGNQGGSQGGNQGGSQGGNQGRGLSDSLPLGAEWVIANDTGSNKSTPSKITTSGGGPKSPNG